MECWRYCLGHVLGSAESPRASRAAVLWLDVAVLSPSSGHMENSLASLVDRVERLKQERQALNATKKEATKQLQKETRRLARLKSAMAKLTQEDLAACLELKARAVAVAKAKASAKAKAAPRPVETEG